jgi:outer membrane protein OmpA-like peptidoglycan-associated protein
MTRWTWFLGACAVPMFACGGAKPSVNAPVNESRATTDNGAAVRPVQPVASDNVTVSADITDGDQTVLGQVARCVTDGPLRGRVLKLVGRADPRGEVEYNMALGARRADSAERYLKDRGVDTRRMTETSRGKLDATGTDESSWARDRRVDVDLI